jgi:hypothetical protein
VRPLGGGVYDRLKGKIVTVGRALSPVACVGEMWDEIEDGIGEAAEPPADLLLYASFTQYRVVLTYLAYWFATPAKGAGDYATYEAWLKELMKAFGLDFDRPQIQLPLDPAASWQDPNAIYRDAYRMVKAVWDKKWVEGGPGTWRYVNPG